MSAFIAVQPIFAQATTTVEPSSGAGAAQRSVESQFNMLPYLFFMVVIFYFLAIRPQQKRAKEQAALVSALKTGDRVVTSNGFHGMIANVKDTTVIVKFAENVKIEVDKASVTNVVKPGSETEAKATPVAKPA